MKKALTIAWKDLRSTYRNPAALAMMLVAPLVLASLLGLAFGGEAGFSITTTKVVLAAEAGNSEAAHFESVLTGLNDGNDRLVDLSRAESEEEARNLVDAGESDVAITVPADLSEVLIDPSGTRSASVLLYENPTKTIGPAIVRGVVQQVVDGLNGARAVAYGAGVLAFDAGVREEQQIAAIASRAAELYARGREQGSGQGLTVGEPRLPDAQQTKNPGVAGQVLIGMMVFFMMIAALNVARTVLDEDYAGTLPRLFTTPTPQRIILGGKFLSVFLVVMVQSLLLLLAGSLLFGTDWGSALPVTLLIVSGALAAAGLGVFLISLAKTPGQAGAIGTGVLLVLALVGGNFVGGAPEGFFSTVRRFTPNGWLLEGWLIAMRGGSPGDVALQVLAALAFAVVLFTAGVLVFRRRYA